MHLNNFIFKQLISIPVYEIYELCVSVCLYKSRKSFTTPECKFCSAQHPVQY